MNIMAEENDPVMAEVMNMLEVEPASSPAAAPDIPYLRVGQGFWVFGIQGRFKSGIRYIAA